MTKIREIIEAIEEFAPLHLQMDFDNSGIQVGDVEQEATGALLCVDVTETVMQEAIDKGANLVISHHPTIFRGLKRLTGSTQTERIVMQAIKRGIVIYASHTNMDITRGGVSFRMAQKLGLSNVQVLSPAAAETGLGVIGNIESVTPLELLCKIKETFHVGAVRYCGNKLAEPITRVAMSGGSCADYIGEAVAQGAQIFVTADVKYHEFFAHSDDIIVADIGHFESEQFTKEIFYEIIQKKFPTFALCYAEKEKNQIKYL